MKKNGNLLGWLAAGLAASGLAMTPALARVLSGQSNAVSLNTIGSFTTAGADPELAASFKRNSLGGKTQFKFTPAGGNTSGDRAVTVVVRQDASSKAISIRENIASAAPGAGVLTPTKITQTSFSLGTAKGLKSFAIPVKKLGDNLPDLSEIGAGMDSDEKDSGKKSRFNPRLSIDAKTPLGAAPGALRASEKDYSLDLGGSYSVTRNLDVTAGVRLKNERDRMAPLTDSRQDSQAVYVGTQFRF
ncbi:hypothetical protein [Parasphingorhabdus cellanae]|uniref:Porin n=1 Tax=Parasphingorhabdus cellanae TaxID=2806553 RepID=A0ABX7T0S9_9SPHN|nr:hypothetical protein [Parasphingorhabdus cellanae]QTD54761.1 hypothetical protein J4G78_10885 [Parasphingorhabdus cellanae]